MTFHVSDKVRNLTGVHFTGIGGTTNFLTASKIRGVTRKQSSLTRYVLWHRNPKRLKFKFQYHLGASTTYGHLERT
jgi:hypothetical protein